MTTIVAGSGSDTTTCHELARACDDHRCSERRADPELGDELEALVMGGLADVRDERRAELCDRLAQSGEVVEAQASPDELGPWWIDREQVEPVGAHAPQDAVIRAERRARLLADDTDDVVGVLAAEARSDAEDAVERAPGLAFGLVEPRPLECLPGEVGHDACESERVAVDRRLRLEDEAEGPDDCAFCAKRDRQRTLDVRRQCRGAIGVGAQEGLAILRDGDRPGSRRLRHERLVGQRETGDVGRLGSELGRHDRELLAVDETQRDAARSEDAAGVRGDRQDDIGGRDGGGESDRELLERLDLANVRTGRVRLDGAPLPSGPEDATDDGDDEHGREVDPPAHQVLGVAEAELATMFVEKQQGCGPTQHDGDCGRAEAAVPGRQGDDGDERRVDRLLADARLEDRLRDQDAGDRRRDRNEIADASGFRCTTRVLVSRGHLGPTPWCVRSSLACARPRV
jgi:hypothetical protein